MKGKKIDPACHTARTVGPFPIWKPSHIGAAKGAPSPRNLIQYDVYVGNPRTDT